MQTTRRIGQNDWPDNWPVSSMCSGTSLLPSPGMLTQPVTSQSLSNWVHHVFKLLLMLHPRVAQHSWRKAISLPHTQAHRCPQLASVTAIAGDRVCYPSHLESMASVGPLAPGHGWVSHRQDSHSRSPNDEGGWTLFYCTGNICTGTSTPLKSFNGSSK